MPDPVAPDSQGYSPNSTPGASQPQASAGISPAPQQDPMASVTGPSAQFSPTTFGSAGDQIKQFQKATLAATAQGGMLQQNAFLANHQAQVDNRTQALGQASQLAQARGVGGDQTFTNFLQQQAGGGVLGLQISNMDNHQADFKAAANARNTAFGNYMKEVGAAIPLAQAAAQQTVATKLAAQKQANMTNQLDALVSTAQQNQTDDQAKRDQAVTAAAPQLQGLTQTEANLNMQLKDAQQTLAEMNKKAPTGQGLFGLGKVGGQTGGATFDQGRKDRVTKQIADLQQRLTDIGTQRNQIQANIESTAPAPKQLHEYVQQYAGQLGGVLGGKATLQVPSIATGEERLAKANAPGDVTRIMSLVPGIKVADANAVLNDQDYKDMKTSAEKGLTVKLDDRGRVTGTQITPWEALSNAVNAHSGSENTKNAILAEYRTRYAAAGRNVQRTAKQQTARG